jgi:hypothetical protein
MTIVTKAVATRKELRVAVKGLPKDLANSPFEEPLPVEKYRLLVEWRNTKYCSCFKMLWMNCRQNGRLPDLPEQVY